MSIRSYLTVKKRDGPELEKVVSSSMADSVKKEIKRTEDGSIERKRGLTKPQDKNRIGLGSLISMLTAKNPLSFIIFISMDILVHTCNIILVTPASAKIKTAKI